MARWKLKEPTQTSSEYSSRLHPLISQLLISRGIADKKEIEHFIAPNYETDTHDPFLFGDMEKVVERVKLAQEKSEIVAIFGDYDADGITSSAILKETLDCLKIESFVYIPDKKVEGYSMNSDAVDMFKEKGVSLIITVDCGITSIAEVEKAKSYGIDVIITDHHHVPDDVPDALAIINPHVEGCGYPFRDLGGVGVAFKVVQALYQKLMPEKSDQTKWMLDLVAIGTIADCVPLVGENRLFVRYGLIVLSKTRRVGLKEMFAVGRMVVDEQNVPDTKKVSFYIAPRINAAGRINHANLAYNLVMEQDVVKAHGLALELEENNTLRQKITETVVAEIRLLSEAMFKDRKFIFAVGEHFPVGVIGLVAGKIAQQFNKPVAVFQKGETESKGSFRSIPQINIIETIGECGDLLQRFGGHSQAAGATVSNGKMNEFFEKMNDIIEKKLEGVDLSEEILIDAELSPKDVDFDLVEGLEKLRPFGEGNTEPIFVIRQLNVKEKRAVGSTSKHVKLLLMPSDGSPKIFEAISFNSVEKLATIDAGDKVDLACMVQKDEWNGNKKIQLLLVDIKKVVE